MIHHNPTPGHTLADALDAYERDYLPHKAPTTQYQERLLYRWLEAELGDIALADLSPLVLRTWRDSLRQTHHNLARDGRRFKLSTWASAARTWFGREGLVWRLLGPGLHYLSPRFHPWQHDNRALLQMWLERNDDAYRAIGSTPS